RIRHDTSKKLLVPVTVLSLVQCVKISFKTDYASVIIHANYKNTPLTVEKSSERLRNDRCEPWIVPFLPLIPANRGLELEIFTLPAGDKVPKANCHRFV